MKVPAYSFAVALAIVSCATSAGAAPLAPHLAVYDISLRHAADRTGIDSVNGRMVFDFTGSSCEGFTTRYRFVMAMAAGEDRRMTDQQTTTYEDGEGTSFSFSTRNFVNSALDKEIRGHASIGAAAGQRSVTVELSKPRAATYQLPAGMFPTRHLVDLIERAEKGETFYEASIFDGSDDADSMLLTTVFIGDRAVAGEADAERKPLGSLAADPAWPVSVAYFSDKGGAGDAVPLYRIDFKLHANGVTRDLVMDYGDYTLSGRLVDLMMNEAATDCP